MLFKNVLKNNNIWKNRELSIKNINVEFNNNKKCLDINESCPICYEYLKDETKCISCPDCKGYIHKDCMNVWLETKKSCVYCRSESFKYYISDISNI
jgi:hypothetical protein